MSTVTPPDARLCVCGRTFAAHRTLSRDVCLYFTEAATTTAATEAGAVEGAHPVVHKALSRCECVTCRIARAEGRREGEARGRAWARAWKMLARVYRDAEISGEIHSAAQCGFAAIMERAERDVAAMPKWRQSAEYRAEAAALTASPPAPATCVCGEPGAPGTHRTDGPCLAPTARRVEVGDEVEVLTAWDTWEVDPVREVYGHRFVTAEGRKRLLADEGVTWRRGGGR